MLYAYGQLNLNINLKVGECYFINTHICGLKFEGLLFGIHNRVFLNICVCSGATNDLKTKKQTHFTAN